MEIGEPIFNPVDAVAPSYDIMIFLRDTLDEPLADIPCILGSSDIRDEVRTDADGRIHRRVLYGSCWLSIPSQEHVRFRITSYPAGAPSVALSRPRRYLLFPGYTYVLRPRWPALHIDAHMHIMSGNCTPLPPLRNLVRDKAGGILPKRLDRGALNTVSRTGVARFAARIGELSWRSTYEIGSHTAGLNDGLPAVYGRHALTRTLPPAGSGGLGISIVLPMDMDYCHLDGYSGEPIYVRDAAGKWFYHERDEGTAHPENRHDVLLRRKRGLDGNETRACPRSTSSPITTNNHEPVSAF